MIGHKLGEFIFPRNVALPYMILSGTQKAREIAPKSNGKKNQKIASCQGRKN